MPDQTPAQTLRAGAAKLRSVTNAIPPNDWDDRPWHVEECSNKEFGECPCIVAQGERKPWDEAQVPLMQYVADAETAEYATWIALMHPGVGAALADWLEATALDYDTNSKCGECHGSCCDPRNCDCIRAALAVARQILGEVTQ